MLVDGSQGQVPIGQLAVGALVGEVGVFADMPRTASVRAHSAVEVLKIGRDDILASGGENPAFLRAMIQQLGERMVAFNEAVGVYTDDLGGARAANFEARLLDDLPQPTPELAGFAHALRRVAARIGLRRVATQLGD